MVISKNGDIKGIFVSKIVKMGISKTFDGFLEINLENGYLKNSVVLNHYLFTL